MNIHYCVLIIMMVCSLAQGATITWDKAQISSELDAVNLGTTLFAYNIGNSNAVLSVNGVTFYSQAAVQNQSTPLEQGSAETLTWSSTMNFVNAGNLSLAGTEGLTGDYATLVGISGTMSGGNGYGTMTFNFNNLTIGNTYVFQIWVNASRESLSNQSSIVFGNSSDGSNSFEASRSEGNTIGSLGDWVTGTFTADSATQSITVNGNQYMKINGIQLRDITNIPEPVTGMLVLLTFLSGFSRRKRS